MNPRGELEVVYPSVSVQTFDEWPQIQKIHFNEGCVFDQAYSAQQFRCMTKARRVTRPGFAGERQGAVAGALDYSSGRL